MITIYNLLKQSGVKFTKNDCWQIGEQVSKLIKSTDRIKQEEEHAGKKVTFTVKNYSEKDAETIYGVIVKHFTKPEKVAEKPKEAKKQRKRIPLKK